MTTMKHHHLPSITRRRACLGLLAAAGGACAQASAAPRIEPSAQQVRAGRLERWVAQPSRFVDARHVEVWLPPGYDGRRPHAVLYMHDGQMLFDAASTWNKQAWQVDQVAAPLIAAGALRDFIVVGVWNNGPLRGSEYYPQGFLDHLQPAELREGFVREGLGGRPRADDYLRFLVEELKPAIDARYATDPGRESSFLMGSSMGGLISLYGLCRYPERFGGAACLSTHWIGGFERRAAFPDAALAWLERHLPAPQRVRLYMDRGTVALDGLYAEDQARVDALLAAKGYRAPAFQSLVFEGALHDERSWNARLERPLRLLLRSAA
jgi:enterochelin esterase-like enzyme